MVSEEEVRVSRRRRTKEQLKVSMERIIEMIEGNEDAGFCIACGEEAWQVEPDARKYTCDSCGEPCVYGAEELLIGAV